MNTRQSPDNTRSHNPLALAAAGLALLALTTPLSAATWQGGISDDFFNGNNWSPVLGGFGAVDLDVITGGGRPTPVINSAGPLAGMRGFWLGKYHAGSVGTAQLNVTAGASANFDGSTARIGLGNGGTGTLNQSGGSLTLHSADVGLDAGANGTVNLAGGTLVLGKANDSDTWSLRLGQNGTGAINISGGAFRTRSGAILGNGVGTGTFTVLGSGATQIGIGSEGSVDGAWVQNVGSTLAARVDAGGVTKIFVDDTGHAGANNGNVTFASGALLDVSFLNSSVSGTWVLMEWEGTLTNNGLAFAPGVDTDIWSFSIDATAKTLSITAAAIPEPATFAALAGLAGLGLAASRRRRAG